MKRITFTMSDDRGTTEIRETFDDDCSWRAVAYSFYKFLHGMGYQLDPDKVGAEVSDYLASGPDEEDLW